MRLLDDSIGDVHTAMMDIAVEIQQALTGAILSHSRLLLGLFRRLATLDWYAASINGM